MKHSFTLAAGRTVWLQRVTCALLLMGAAPGKADNLQGIRYMDSLGEVRQRYPYANFVPSKPAWLQPNEAFYTVTGEGLPGVLRIAFDDGRPFYKALLQDNAGDTSYDTNGSIKKLSVAPDNDALNVSWVRWSPVNPIPMQRYKQRYGAPACSYDASMLPICIWESVALEAQMSDDQQSVLFVTTSFTKQEKRSAYQRRLGYIPAELK